MTVEDRIRGAQTALAAARVALREAGDRVLVDAPDRQAAVDDALRRYARAMELIRRAREPIAVAADPVARSPVGDHRVGQVRSGEVRP